MGGLKNTYDNNFFDADNHQLSETKKDDIRKLIKEVSCKLYFHEKEKDLVSSRTHIKIPVTDNIAVKQLCKKKYYYYYTNIFYGVIVENVLINAAKNHPGLFGKNNSENITEALNLERPGFCSDDSIYKEEQYCYVIEEDEKGQINKEKILKIQLFRFQELTDKKSPSSKVEFTGGLFHAFKHFTFNGINLSMQEKPGYNLDYHPSYFISDITEAFFNTELIWTKDKNNKEGLLGSFNKINFYFFYNKEANLNVYFLTTAYPKIKAENKPSNKNEQTKPNQSHN